MTGLQRSLTVSCIVSAHDLLSRRAIIIQKQGRNKSDKGEEDAEETLCQRPITNERKTVRSTKIWPRSLGDYAPGLDPPIPSTTSSLVYPHPSCGANATRKCCHLPRDMLWSEGLWEQIPLSYVANPVRGSLQYSIRNVHWNRSDIYTSSGPPW